MKQTKSRIAIGAILALILIFSVFPTVLTAEDIERNPYPVRGYVYTPANETVPEGVVVTITDTTRGVSVTATTDATGFYYCEIYQAIPTSQEGDAFTCSASYEGETGSCSFTLDLSKLSQQCDLTVTEKAVIFDTGRPENPYPSIFGTHNGTITPYHDINVSKIYTYPCPGTGGHTEYVFFYNATTGEEIANGTWNGYQGAGDYHYIVFEKSFMLKKEVTYNYTISTGSYPQIHHTPALPTANGWINCTEFIDANGKKYNNWIPAIRLE